MPLPTLDVNRAPELLYGDILDYIVEAEALIAADDVLALEGLNDAVDMLCARIVALTPDTGKDFTPKLVTLMERMNQLEEKMLKAREEVAGNIKALNQTKKANQAYQKNKPEA